MITPSLMCQMTLHALASAGTNSTSPLLPAEHSAGVAARLPLAGRCGAAVSKVQHGVLAMVWRLCAAAPHNCMLLLTDNRLGCTAGAVPAPSATD